MSLENNNNADGLSAMEADVAELFDLAIPATNAPSGGEAPSSSPAPEPGVAVGQAPAAAPEPPVSPESPAAPSPAPAASGEPTAPVTPSAAPNAPAPSAAPVPPVDEQALKLQSLEATVEALQAELATSRANPAPVAGTPAAPAAGPESGEQPPAYRLTLPQQVAEAIFDEENPERRIAGITHMMNSLAAIVHHNVRLEMNGRFQALVDQARTQEASTQTAEVVESSRNQYYDAFPAHKNELILPLIQAESRSMAAEFPNAKWDQNYINALGTRVNNRIAALTGGGQPPVTNITPPAAPAPSLPSGTRTEVPGSNPSEIDVIADTFS
jgi:hypothetical protein